MAIIINLIAALILFYIPIREYKNKDNIVAVHPFDEEKRISINYELFFLVYSVVTAMVFLGPLSMLKYGFWIIFLLFLGFSGRLEFKKGAIVNAYLLFLFWALISALFYSTVRFQALMMLVKYALPLFYLWLGYTAINDSDDLVYFMKKVVIGMCIYALIIGGFSAKFISPLYGFLCFGSGGLFIAYASLADYFSGLIVLPIGLYLITEDKKWLYATLWIILSTILETVRTGLGGIFLASSFFLVTIFRGKAIPWIGVLIVAGVAVVFTVPSFREKMFLETTTVNEVSLSEANFDNIQSNGREAIWEVNLERFYDPHKITGSGLGESVEWMKNRPGELHLIHSDYVQILCDLGLIGMALFGMFVVVTIIYIISYCWRGDCPLVLKLTGGMALGSCAGTFFSMAFDNVIAYSQQSFVIPFILIGIFLKINDLYQGEEWQ